MMISNIIDRAISPNVVKLSLKLMAHIVNDQVRTHVSCHFWCPVSATHAYLYIVKLITDAWTKRLRHISHPGCHLTAAFSGYTNQVDIDYQAERQ
jgi:hypothetical protein